MCLKIKTNNLNLSKTQCQSNIPICMANVAKKAKVSWRKKNPQQSKTSRCAAVKNIGKSLHIWILIFDLIHSDMWPLEAQKQEILVAK